MGPEIPAGMGVALAKVNQDHVFVVVGDGTYLMQPSELVTAVSERLKMTVVIIENSGFQGIRARQTAITGHENFGNEFRFRTNGRRHPDGSYVDVDYAMNARSMGCATFETETPEQLWDALEAARNLERPSVIVAHAEKGGGSTRSGLWWDIGVAEVSGLDRVKAAFCRP